MSTKLLTLQQAVQQIELFITTQPAVLEKKIPNLLFQYWDHNPPEEVQILLNTNLHRCQQLGIEYVLFSDAEAIAFLQAHYPQQVLDAYQLAVHPAMKSDLIRLCYLHEKGGFYLDADMVLSASCEPLFSCGGDLVCFKWNDANKRNICNWLMGAISQSPILKLALDSVAENILQSCQQDKITALKNTLIISGPGVFTQAIGSYIGSNFAHCYFHIETTDTAYVWINKARAVLKTSLAYKKTNLHWHVAARNHSLELPTSPNIAVNSTTRLSFSLKNLLSRPVYFIYALKDYFYPFGKK